MSKVNLQVTTTTTTTVTIVSPLLCDVCQKPLEAGEEQAHLSPKGFLVTCCEHVPQSPTQPESQSGKF